jgi:hypothetical protein
MEVTVFSWMAGDEPATTPGNLASLGAPAPLSGLGAGALPRLAVREAPYRPVQRDAGYAFRSVRLSGGDRESIRGWNKDEKRSVGPA